MVFGFGFSKQKALSSGEKYVQQGKLQNAIAEYEKIVKVDAKDQTVLNTIGDLYARVGDTARAIEYFKKVGDGYAADGFTVKAIAVYKKISKLQPSLEGTLKLAELFTQQGLFNDARAQYLQVAEEFLRSGELERAIGIFKKTLEMDPDNVAMKLRLAEVYLRLGKKADASKIYSEASQTLRDNGQLDAADEVLQKMQALDPSNSAILLLRGRNAMEAGEVSDAIQLLEKVADLDQHPEGLHDLMKAYLQNGQLPKAGLLAGKLFTVHHDTQAIAQYADALMAAGSHAETLKVYQQHADALLSAEPAKVLDNLHSIIGHVRDDRDALETILALLRKAGDTTHDSEILELLAHASVQQDDLPKARDLYLQLATMEPQNPLHSRNYQQVVAKLGSTGEARPITSEEGALMVDELEAIAPFIDQHYSEEVTASVRAALTDAELFVSYNMPEKALGPLLAALPSAPHHVKLNQRLAALHTRTGQFAESALCCRTLQGVYANAGFHEEDSRYGDLASKYEERGTLAAAAAATDDHPALPSSLIATPAWPAPEASAPAAPPVVAACKGPMEFAVVTPEPEADSEDFHTAAASHAQPASTHTENSAAVQASAEVIEEPAINQPGEEEIDLSAEWEGSSEEVPAAASATADSSHQPAALVNQADAVAATVAEINFYTQYGMTQQAQAALAKLETLTDDRSTLDAVRAEVQHKMATAEKPAEAAPVEATAAPEMQPEAASYQEPAPVEAAPADDELFDVEVADAEPEPTPEPVIAASAPPRAPAVLDAFVADLEASLPEDFMAPSTPAVSPSIPPAYVIAAPPQSQPAFLSDAAHGSAAAAQPARESAPAPSIQALAIQIPTIAAQPQPPVAAAPALSANDALVGAELNDMFDELRSGMDDEAETAQEDPEDHYNLGVAFREMGLLDEAIGELQKVCQAIDRGQPFKYTMQAYTWLAQCFLDKGVPEGSIRWYEKALKLQGIDEEAKTALHYELATAYEAAQNKRAALAHYMEVYGANIDYRDIGARIQALRP